MADTSVWTIGSIGFLLGLRHALDGDHVAAVATLVAKRPTMKTSGFVGLCWGIGHTLVLLVVGLALVAFDFTISPAFSQVAEGIVGIMLVVLGGSLLWSLVRERWHIHAHQHEGTTHLHFHSHRLGSDHTHDHMLGRIVRPMAVGMVHGLAGSAAVVLVILSTVNALWEVVGTLAIFGLGSMLGMMVISIAMTIPVRWSGAWSPSLLLGLRLVASIGSIGLGVAVLSGWGINPGHWDFSRPIGPA